MEQEFLNPMPEKKYTPEGLEILDDALETIRRRPDVYLPSGELRGDALSARLVDDIACVCTLAVAVLQHDQWWIVACEEDWVDMNYRRWLERRQRAKLPSIDGGIESYFVNLV